MSKTSLDDDKKMIECPETIRLLINGRSLPIIKFSSSKLQLPKAIKDDNSQINAEIIIINNSGDSAVSISVVIEGIEKDNNLSYIGQSNKEQRNCDVLYDLLTRGKSGIFEKMLKAYDINFIHLEGAEIVKSGPKIPKGKLLFATAAITGLFIFYQLEKTFDVADGKSFVVIDSQQVQIKSAGRALQLTDQSKTYYQEGEDFAQIIDPNVEYKISLIQTDISVKKSLISQLNKSIVIAGQKQENDLEHFQELERLLNKRVIETEKNYQIWKKPGLATNSDIYEAFEKFSESVEERNIARIQAQLVKLGHTSKELQSQLDIALSELSGLEDQYDALISVRSQLLLKSPCNCNFVRIDDTKHPDHKVAIFYPKDIQPYVLVNIRDSNVDDITSLNVSFRVLPHESEYTGKLQILDATTSLYIDGYKDEVKKPKYTLAKVVVDNPEKLIDFIGHGVEVSISKL